MNKEFVPYEQAIELKELGFDEPCFTYYYDDNGKIRTGLSIHINNGWTYKGTKKLETTLAPTFSQAFRWFREKYGHNGVIEGSKRFGFEWCIYRDELEYIKPPNNSNTYEEAELDCLKKLIEIVKKETN